MIPLGMKWSLACNELHWTELGTEEFQSVVLLSFLD